MDHTHAGHANHQPQHEHDAHAGHSVNMFKSKFWLSLLLTVPVLAYSPMIQEWLGFTPPVFAGSSLVPFVLSTIIFAYGGTVFLKGAWSELRAKLPGMMTLISLAILTAFGYSVATQFFIDGDNFFWELATLITIMLLGHWLEMASIAKAQNALETLSQLLPDTAEKLVNGEPQEAPVSELALGDDILVRPGARIPADGTVKEGESSVDESIMSGESKPVYKTKNAQVVAGTQNQDGSLVVSVTKVGSQTALAGIMRLVAEAQHSKSRAQVLADRAAFALTLIALVSGIITFIYWFFAKDAGFALERMVTVFVIACPHALGLAIPLVVSISTAISARNGLLVRKRMALEAARKVSVVLFDKTGTLTQGKHGVTNVFAAPGYSEKEVLQVAANLEQKSEHIVGKGIVAYAKSKGIKTERIANFKALPGLGVTALIKAQPYVAASRRYVTEQKLHIPNELEHQTSQAAKAGKTEVFIISGSQVIGAIMLADMLRPESAEAVKSLQKQGMQVAMLTGDSRDVAAYVAKQLGLNTYYAEVRPGDKAAKVKELQQAGAVVAMVGDGINDAPALTQADVGLAIGAGTDVAVQSADIILVKDDPRDVAKVTKLSHAAYRKMLQNLWWAAGYNVLAIPLAAGVLYGFGITLSPAVGAVLMSLSTIIVALNAQLLRRLSL